VLVTPGSPDPPRTAKLAAVPRFTGASAAIAGWVAIARVMTPATMGQATRRKYPARLGEARLVPIFFMYLFPFPMMIHPEG
jgi:hypothetical protein